MDSNPATNLIIVANGILLEISPGHGRYVEDGEGLFADPPGNRKIPPWEFE
jgi:hypothetical protein